MNDTVSRKAVMEVLLETIAAPSILLDTLEMRINALPSAKAEIPTCRNCYWWTKQESSMQGRCSRYGFYPTGYWYCAGAMEKKDNG